ncbi:SEN2 subunit of tRNA-splicing endonuclease [Penicillium cosmopolitanum]|uniref:tRNA-splicing endonuclease subunit Sen2 n=1 Tax=Penicillium cosmopolitanum TaxID=1131564 RepID=A0A9W9VEC5_9EURO|nr:SEN2 subunit of tRNA-splicing endonuclease [Penicillium cosmopolitanum]KAJ5379013.1 SEN2 subunit of tRNA-splicing endonuclease [Penicillium cosmopolitanum]
MADANATSVAQTSPEADPARVNPRPARAPRPPRPNYRLIHRFPLPVNAHPVPPVIPHNPLSILSAALSYLSFLISRPSQEIHSAYFDPATSSIHVTDEKAIRALWEMGFFGKGSLSRSEPSWLEREKKRRGLLGGNTSEEATRRRREERRALKLERARSEKLLIDERLKLEAAARESGSTAPSLGDSVDDTVTTIEKFSVKKAMEAKYQESRLRRSQNGTSVPPADTPESSQSKSVRFSSVVEQKEATSTSTARLQGSSLADADELDIEDILENQEHLQISNEEAFFLVYGLGVLRVFDREQNTVIPTSNLLPLLRRNSYFPPHAEASELNPDDPFMLSYVVYHHFRSLGWVVRSGVKFGTDYLLYNRGPVFSHAEFALIIIPSYNDPYWSETEERREYVTSKQSRSWWWLHCVNRVQAQVKKSLVICYVEVPPPTGPSEDIAALLGQYQVREFLLRRWIPNRTRD